MKSFNLIIVGLMLAFASVTSAQISVNVNIGSPPTWGPSGYNNVRYYYLPDVESYYDVQNSSFIYYSGNTWVRRTSLPAQYRNYDLHRGYKVVMTNYRGNAPYTYYKQHKIKYAKGYRNGQQSSNRDYKKSKGSPHNGNQHQMQNKPNSQPQHGNKENNKGHGNEKGHGNKKGH